MNVYCIIAWGATLIKEPAHAHDMLILGVGTVLTYLLRGHPACEWVYCVKCEAWPLAAKHHHIVNAGDRHYVNNLLRGIVWNEQPAVENATNLSHIWHHDHYTTVPTTCRMYWILPLWPCQGLKSVLTFTFMTVPRCEECTHLYIYDCARVWRVYSPLHLWLCQGVKSVFTFTFMTVPRCEECTHLCIYDCAKTVYCSEGVWKLLLYVSNVRADMHMEWPVTSEDAQEPSVLVQGVPRRCAVGHHWR